MDIFRQGVNCVDVFEDLDIRVLVSGKTYFDELVESLEHAQSTIYIAGWELEGQMWLQPDTPAPVTLEAFLKRLISQRPSLNVYMLIWDLSEMKRMANNPILAFRPSWFPHRRLKLRFDDHYPFGGCHHQKYVVIDDAIAYIGGMDLTVGRWDNSEHLAENPDRCDAFGVMHPAVQDVQVRVTGEPAKTAGDLFRSRWRRVSRTSPITPRFSEPIEFSHPTIRAKQVAISRTDPWDTHPVFEVEQLFIDTIQAAQKYIYIENQYLTSEPIGRVLAARLREPDGPEVIIVGPKDPAGWIEEVTVGLLRWRVIEAIRNADQFGRLRIVYPMISVESETSLYIHSKLMIVDDSFVRVGSANISQRSFRIDTELDLSFTTDDVNAVRSLLAELLATYFGLSSTDLEGFVEDPNRTIRSTLDYEMEVGRDRTLKTLGKPPDARAVSFAQDGDILFDPDEARTLAQVTDLIMGSSARKRFLARLPRGLMSVTIWTSLLLVGAAIGDQMTSEFGNVFIVFEDQSVRLGLLALMLLGLSLGAPLFLIVVASMVIYPSPIALLVMFGLVILSAILTYNIGSVLGRNILSRIWGLQIQDVRKQLFRRGVFSVITLRFFPISTFAAVGFAAGAASSPMRPYLIGTAIGVVPIVSLFSVLAFFVSRFIVSPNPADLVGALASLYFTGLIQRSVAKRLTKSKN